VQVLSILQNMPPSTGSKYQLLRGYIAATCLLRHSAYKV